MSQDYFKLFGLPVHYELDLDNLQQRYRLMMAQVHPDQFAHLSSMEQRVAMQKATLVHTAYDTLRDPLARAQYLLDLWASPLTASALPQAKSSDLALSHDFLLQQMQWRERLEEGDTTGLAAEVAQLQTDLLANLSAACAAQHAALVAELLNQARFVTQFLAQITQAAHAPQQV